MDFDLICCVINDGQGSKAVQIASRYGVKSSTILIGRGSVNNKLLEMLDLDYIMKEIVIMITPKNIAEEIATVLTETFSLNKRNHGILFIVELNSLVASRYLEYSNIGHKKERIRSMYEVIFSVVNKGFAEDVIEAAKKGGAKGGTIMNARGSGIHESNIVFAMPIEPEKEVVFIIAENNLTEAIVKSICTELNIKEPGNGIIFTLPANKVYGLRD